MQKLMPDRTGFSRTHRGKQQRLHPLPTQSGNGRDSCGLLDMQSLANRLDLMDEVIEPVLPCQEVLLAFASARNAPRSCSWQTLNRPAYPKLAGNSLSQPLTLPGHQPQLCRTF